MAAFEASGGNILNLAQIAADVLGMPSTIILPNEQNLENDIVGLIGLASFFCGKRII